MEQAQLSRLSLRRALGVCGAGGRNFYELPAGAGKRDPPSDPFWGGHCKKKKVIAELSSLSAEEAAELTAKRVKRGISSPVTRPIGLSDPITDLCGTLSSRCTPA